MAQRIGRYDHRDSDGSGGQRRLAATFGLLGALLVAVFALMGPMESGHATAAPVDGQAGTTANVNPAVAGLAQTEDFSVFLPLTFCRAGIGHLLRPLPLPSTPTASRTPEGPATITPTPPPSPTPRPSDTPGPTETPTPPLCTEPLESRLVTTTIDVEGTIATGASGQWTRFPLFMDVRADGRALIGWSTTSNEVRLTPIDTAGAREGADISIPGESLHGLVAHDDGGGAALVARPDEMHLVRFTADGTVLYDKLLVGDTPRGLDGSKWIDSWGYEGRLRWTGTAYAAYFGHTGYFAAAGKHQGDLLWLFDEDGEKLSYEDAPQYPSWDWGCSHSLDVRLAYNHRSDSLGPMCLSDGFPYPGFIFRHANRVGDEVSADGSGRADGHLGGIVPVGNGFAVTYGTESRRQSYDIALTLISEFGFSLMDYWLTDTPAVEEDGPHLATYGEDLLVGWQAGRSLMLSVVNLDGAFVEDPVAVEADVAARDDFVNFPNGDAGWATIGGGRSSITRVVVPYCE